MNVVFVILVVIAPIFAQSPTYNFDCETLLPQGRAVEEKETTPAPFQFLVNAPKYVTGGKVTVTLSSEPGFHAFIVQARKVLDNSVIGQWEGQRPITCGKSSDTVTHSTVQDHNGVELTWTAPPTTTGAIKFVTTVIDKNNKFWHNIVSENIDEFSEEPEEDAEVAYTVQQQQAEAEEEVMEGEAERIRQGEADAEDRSRVEEERRVSQEEESHRNEIQWEMMESERHEWQEAEARRARIHAEEEATRLWQEKQKAQETNNGKGVLKIKPKDTHGKTTSGISIATVSMATILTLLAAMFVL